MSCPKTILERLIRSSFAVQIKMDKEGNQNLLILCHALTGED